MLESSGGGVVRVDDCPGARSCQENDDLHRENIMRGKRTAAGCRRTTADGGRPRHIRQPGRAWKDEEHLPPGMVQGANRTRHERAMNSSPEANATRWPEKRIMNTVASTAGPDAFWERDYSLAASYTLASTEAAAA